MNRLILGIGVLLITSNIFASAVIGLGNGGKFDSSSLSIGFKGQDWGGNLSFISNSDYTKDEINDYQVPHNSYFIKDEEAYIGNTTGFDIQRYYSINNNHSFFVGGGLYFSKVCKIAQSTATNWLYCQEKNDKTDIASIFGYVYNRTYGISYNSIRGTEISIIYNF
jgi:hypothetical protein